MNIDNWKTKRWYYKEAGLVKYLFVLVFLIVASVTFSFFDNTWDHVSRIGGIITIFGATLLVRRLQRLGPYHVNKGKEPFIKNGNQFNMKGVKDDIEKKIDYHAQQLGYLMIVVGTILWSYGNYVLELLWPFRT